MTMTPPMSSPKSPPPSATTNTSSTSSTNKASSSTTTTPGRSNYAAPHTPIASAKRPRHPGTGSRRSVGNNNNSISNSNSNSNSASKLNDIHEHSTNDANANANANANATGGIMTPVRKMKLDSPNGTNASDNDRGGVPMSPMHPARPVTGKDKDTTTATTSTSIAADSTNDNVPSKGGSVLQSIFSPVLNFLNHKSDDDVDVDAPVHDCAVHYCAVPVSVPSNIHTTHVVTDTDGDVTMQEERTPSGSGPGPGPGHEETYVYTTTTTTHANVNANVDADADTADYQHEHEHDTYNHDNEQDKYGQYTTAPSIDSVEVVEDDQDQHHDHGHDDDASEEEEFNPYLFIKYLPPYQAVVPFPHRKICLPPKDPSDPPISLVLDLDETLVHCTVEPIDDADMTFPVFFNGIQYKVHVRTRPFLIDFLEAVAGKFEVIVFTASQEVYANELLDRIDPDKKYIKHRMFRDSCLLVEGNYLKDLSVLGRDLSQSILVDNSPHAFGYQVDNGVPIESWFEDPNDTELLKLEQFCSTLHGVNDVRTMVRSKFQTYKRIRDAM